MSGENENGAPPAGGEAETGWLVDGVEIPAPPPGAQLNTTGRRLYRWICEALLRNERKIDAAGIQITMLVHTMLSWAADMSLVTKEGRYGISENGNRYELPHSYNERAARTEIRKELPEACLTVMSEIEARLKESRTQQDSGQDDLFAELLEHGQKSPRNDGLH